MGEVGVDGVWLGTVTTLELGLGCLREMGVGVSWGWSRFTGGAGVVDGVWLGTVTSGPAPRWWMGCGLAQRPVGPHPGWEEWWMGCGCGWAQ